jgi:hypothetical protein
VVVNAPSRCALPFKKNFIDYYRQNPKRQYLMYVSVCVKIPLQHSITKEFHDGQKRNTGIYHG